MSPVVEIRGLTVQRDSYILRGVDWTILPGENWVLLGANGSGKTSLLKSITGYMTESSGQIVIDGKADADWQTLRERIGFVSSSVSQRIEDEESVLEILISGRYAMINYWGPIRRADKADAQAVLEQIEASHLEKRFWWQLSQGERQRILIGRALMSANRILLILDEPCAGLDPAARETFLGFLERFASDSATPGTILVTHHVEEITPSFTRVLMLKEGQVLANGEIRQTLRDEMVTEAFGMPVRVTKSRASGRYSLRFL